MQTQRRRDGGVDATVGATGGATDFGLAWEHVCAAVRARIGERNFDAWIAPLRTAWTPEALVLEAPDATTRNWVVRHFASVIESAVATTLRRPWPIRLELTKAPPPLPIRATSPPEGHTFEAFVVGEANRAAYVAARAVLSDGRSPLFVHGPVGVGKTHLLHAVYHALDARGTLATCLPAAQLVSSLVGAYGVHSHEAFWRDLAPLGGLLLDDVHSLAGQEEVQERLMSGLVTWVESGRLLVLTCDRPPDALPELTARLRERFAGDAIAGIAPPEPALRVAILQQKARSQGLPIDPGLAGWLAAHIGGNVRRLEGALTKLGAHASLLGRRIDLRLAEEVLPELLARPFAPLTVDRIIDETAAVFGAAARAVRGRSRRAALVLPRQVAMYLARKLLARPFTELARAFARDHTTVLHAWESVAARLGSDPKLAHTVEHIERRLVTDAGKE